MYVTEFNSNSVHQHTLSTPWDIGTASFDKSFDTSNQSSNPAGVFLGDNGGKMYVSGFSSLNIDEYSLASGPGKNLIEFIANDDGTTALKGRKIWSNR